MTGKNSMVCIYENHSDAEAAVKTLKTAGFHETALKSGSFQLLAQGTSAEVSRARENASSTPSTESEVHPV